MTLNLCENSSAATKSIRESFPNYKTQAYVMSEYMFHIDSSTPLITLPVHCSSFSHVWFRAGFRRRVSTGKWLCDQALWLRDWHTFRPMLWAPLSELHGRRKLFIFTYVLFTIFNGGVIASQNIWTLIILRFLAGTAGSSPLTNAGYVFGRFSQN